MITNERQYRITRSWLEQFERARTGVEEQRSELHPRARQALSDQCDSQIEELRAQLAEYEALRRGDVYYCLRGCCARGDRERDHLPG